MSLILSPSLIHATWRSQSSALGSSQGLYPFFSQYHTFSRTPARATTLTASPNASARPTRPTLCAYSSGRSGRVALITNGRPATSKPRAATSVHTRIRAAPSLNARRFSRRSAVDRDAPSTAHEYSLCGPLSRAAPPEPLFRPPEPPPAERRSASRRSQSWFVRQNTRHCSGANASRRCKIASGLKRLVASDARARASIVSFFVPSRCSSSASGRDASASATPSCSCARSVASVARSPACLPRRAARANLASTATTAWCTVSGSAPASFPLRSIQCASARHVASASRRTSGECSVAENISVWRALAGSRARIFAMASAIPASSNRSASSRMNTPHRPRSISPASTRSRTRPGVPTATSTPTDPEPDNIARCDARSSPPTKSATRGLGETRYREN